MRLPDLARKRHLRRGSGGKLNPLVLAAIAGVGILAAIIAFSAFFVGYSKKVAEDRRSARESMSQVLQEASKVSKGDAPKRDLKFPDTPIGNINRLLYETLLEEARLQVWFVGELERIGWDWVMTPESLRTKENLEECLRRIAETKKVTAKLEREGLGLFAKLIRRMEPFAKGSREARDFLQGFKRGVVQPGGGYALAKRSYAAIHENHATLEAAIRFLRSRVGKFDVDEDGALLFHADVPDRDLDAYDALAEKINASMEQIDRIEKLRQSGLSSAIDEMSKP